MSVLSTKTKTKIGTKTAKQVAKHPKLALRGARGAKPLVWGVVIMRTRQARHTAAAVIDASRSIGQTIFDAGRTAAQAQTSSKRSSSRVAVGIAIGSGAMYFLDPVSGNERRHAVIGLITPNGRSGDQNDRSDADNEAGGPAHPAPGHLAPEHR